MEQGNPQIPEAGYLFLNPTHPLACIEVLNEQINNFQYFADHVRHNMHTLDNNPIVKEAWSCVTIQLAFIYA
jgi:hypothetical protein